MAAAQDAKPIVTLNDNNHDVDTQMSDYGSDVGFDDIGEHTAVVQLPHTIPKNASIHKGRVLPSIEFEEGEREDQEHDVHLHKPTVLRVANCNNAHVVIRHGAQGSPLLERNAGEVEYGEASRQAWSGALIAVSTAKAH